MNLFPMFEKPATFPNLNMGMPENLINPMEFLPHHPGFIPFLPTRVDSSFNKPVMAEPETGEMTIFYGGQVIVINNFPADRAREVMNFASSGNSKIYNSTFPSYATRSDFASNFLLGTTSFYSTCSFRAASPRQLIDLPLARKASLRRFLKRRKDRHAAKAPYQISKRVLFPTEPAENKSWLGLAGSGQ